MAFKMKGSSYKMGGVKTKQTMAYMKSPLEQSKPDYIDIDKDGDTTESMKEASMAKMKSPLEQASPMKVAGGVFAIDPADEEQERVQIPTDIANKVENARDNLYKIIEDPNSTDKEIRAAERRLDGLASVSYSGINAYTDPNSPNFIPELKGASKQQVHEYTENLGEWSDENQGGYRAKDPKKQKLWEDLVQAVDFESTQTGKGQTRRQAMLDE